MHGRLERIACAGFHCAANDIEGLNDLGPFLIIGEALLERAFHGGDEFLGFQPSFGEDAHRHVLEGVFDRLANHRFHRRIVDIDRGFPQGHDGILVGGDVSRKDLENAVFVDFELHADSGPAFGSRLKTDVEISKFPVVIGHFSFSLQHAKFHDGLPIRCVGESFACLAGDGGIARNQHIHQPSKRFDAKAERSNIEQNHFSERTAKNATLDGGPQCNGFVGVL